MFFDNASTTQIDEEILKEFARLNNDNFYNPGALYSHGRAAKKMLDNMRISILSSLNGAEGAKIVFTGSATEANNLALFGVLKKNIGKILVSMGEHPSVYNAALEIKARGYDVEFINLDKTGKVDYKDFESKMTRDVGLVSIMHVSNETGAINDIAKLVAYAKDINSNVIFHCDGVQAVGKIPVDLEDMDVDMYTISAHKIHGMKGVGALYVKKDIKLKPIIFGGGQENGLRSGTENLLGVYSLAKAIEKSVSALDEYYKHVEELKQIFIKNMKSSGLNFSLNSNDDNSPYIVSISFAKCRAETLLNMLDDCGVFIGNGSACSSKNSGNRILEAMGLDKSVIEGNLRISFSRYNTNEEVEKLCQLLIECVSNYLSKTL